MLGYRYPRARYAVGEQGKVVPTPVISQLTMVPRRLSDKGQPEEKW